MKTIKKLLMAIAISAALSTSAFAASGFEFILNVPFGLSVGIPQKSMKDSGFKNGVGFDIGVSAQLGYMIGITDGMGISILGEIGYSHDTYVISGEVLSQKLKYSQSFESLQIGLLPKFNIGAFAIGIGGGIKVPFASTLNINAGDLKATTKLNMSDLNTAYDPAIIGYIKGTFDYSIFFTYKLAMNIGLYLGYDFMPKEKLVNEQSGSFDIGLQLGFKFGPKA